MPTYNLLAIGNEVDKWLLQINDRYYLLLQGRLKSRKNKGRHKRIDLNINLSQIIILIQYFRML